MDKPPHDSQVFVISLRCVECGRRWDEPGERWRVYFHRRRAARAGHLLSGLRASRVRRL